MVPNDLASESATSEEASTSGDSSTDAFVDDAKHDDAEDAEPEADAAVDVDAGPPTYEQTVLADEPVSFWHLDESSGIVLADVMGRHPLTVVNPTEITFSTAGATKTGTAMRLSGMATLQGDVAFDLQGLKPFSIELWMRPTSTDGGFRQIFSKFTLGDGGPADGSYLWWNYGITALRFERWQARTELDHVGITTSMPDDRFVHVVVTMDGKRLTMYVDALAVGLGNNPAVSAPDPSTAFSWGNGFKGYLDELAFYDKALSGERVKAHFDVAHAAN